MRSGGDADGPRSADVVVDGFEFEVVVEDLNAAVAAVAHIDIALGIHGQGVGKVELAGRRPVGAGL